MSKAVGFLTGQASMAFEMLSTAWKALKKKIVAESFFFIMHGQLLPNLIDQRIAINFFPLSKISFGTLIIQPNSTLRLRACVHRFPNVVVVDPCLPCKDTLACLVHCETVKINHLLSTFFCSNSLHCFGYKTHLKHL